jgi:hypothetical protein
MKPSEFIHPEDAAALRQLDTVFSNDGAPAFLPVPFAAKFCTNCGSPLN